MRNLVACQSLLIVFCLISAITFSQENSLGEFSSALKHKFMSESATLKDAEMVVQNLLSSKDEEFSKGLFFAPFVTPRFPSLKGRIEEKVVQILNNKKANRFFQGAEAALAINFSKENAEKLLLIPDELENNLIKTIIKEKAGIELGNTFERIVKEINSKRGEADNPAVDGKSLKEAFKHCTLFKEIIEISFSMKYFSVAFEFSRIISDHPNEFDRATIVYANETLEELKKRKD